jgi:hypothetical protein
MQAWQVDLISGDDFLDALKDVDGRDKPGHDEDPNPLSRADR